MEAASKIHFYCSYAGTMQRYEKSLNRPKESRHVVDDF